MASLLESSYSTSIIENLLDQIQRLKSDLKEKTDLLISSENRQKSLQKTILSLSATCREQECTIQELEEKIEELEANEHEGNNDEELVDVEMDDPGMEDEYEELDSGFEEEDEDLNDEEMDEEDEEDEDPADHDDSDYESTDESEDEDLEETLDAAELIPSASSVAPSHRNDSVLDVGKEQTVEREKKATTSKNNPKTRRVNLIERHFVCQESKEETREASEIAPVAKGCNPTIENDPVVKEESTEIESGVQRVVRMPKITNTIWECQLCGIKCSAQWNQTLRSHVGAHNAFHLPCVVKGCKSVFKQPQTLRSHLNATHKKQLSNLNKVESQKYKHLCHEFWKKTKPLQSVFFPVTAFVNYARKQRSGAAAKCKKCGESVAARNSVRIAHVLSHIKVRSECPIGGCNRVFAGLKELHRHLENDHRTNLMKMAESEIQKFIEGQTRVNGAVNSVFYQYFDSVEV